MKKAHDKMKIGKDAFNSTWNHLESALVDYKVSKKEINQLK